MAQTALRCSIFNGSIRLRKWGHVVVADHVWTRSVGSGPQRRGKYRTAVAVEHQLGLSCKLRMHHGVSHRIPRVVQTSVPPALMLAGFYYSSSPPELLPIVPPPSCRPLRMSFNS